MNVKTDSRHAGAGVNDKALPPCLLKRGTTGEQVPLQNSVISNLMIHQDRLETNTMQLFAHT